MTPPRESNRPSLADLSVIKINEPVTCPSDVLGLADRVSKLAYAQTCELRDMLEQGRQLVVEVSVMT